MTLLGFTLLLLALTIPFLLPLAYIYLYQRAANAHTAQLRLEALPHYLRLAFLKQTMHEAQHRTPHWWFSLGIEEDELLPEDEKQLLRYLTGQMRDVDAAAWGPLERLEEMEVFCRWWWNPFLGLGMPLSMRKAYEEGELRFFPGCFYRG